MTIDVFTGEVDGQRAAFLVPTIPDQAPELVREGIARRRLVVLTGTCPCGAVHQLPNRAERRRAQRAGRIIAASVEHDPRCPAIDPATEAHVRRGLGAL